jgi:hypothetical protein
MGCSVQIGYNKSKNKLVPYISRASNRSCAASKTLYFGPQSAQLPGLDVDSEIMDEFSRQIRSMASKFLWRYSQSLTFHEVQWHGQPYRVGYSTRYGTLYAYLDPPSGYSYEPRGLPLAPHPAEADLE